MDSDSTKRTPEAELRSYIDRLDPQRQKLLRSVRSALRRQFPSANELAYDYSSHVVIAYSPTDRGIDAIVSIATRDDGVQLYFNHGPQLPDPKGMLLGKGKQTRFVPVESARQLAHPDLQALLAAAIDLADMPLPAEGKGKLLIRPTAASKRSGGRSAT